MNAGNPQTITVVRINDLLPELRDALTEARNSGDLRSKRIREVIADHFDFLGPFIVAKIETRDVGGGQEDFLVLSFTPPKGRDLGRAERAFDRASQQAGVGRLEPARRVFEKLTQDFPEVAKYHRALGQTYLELGDLDAAETHLLHSLKLNPRDTNSLTLLGNILARSRRHEDAIPLYQRSLALDQNVYAQSNLAVALAETGRTPEAVEAFEAALALDPSYPNAWFGLGLALSRTREPEELPRAIGALDRALQVVKSRRSEPQVWDRTREVLKALTEVAAQHQAEDAMRIAQEVAKTEERVFGVPVVITEQRLKGFLAKIEYAWIHGRSAHRIITLPDMVPERQHQILHELEHLRLTNLARAEGRNRWFGTSEDDQERALTDFKEDVRRLTGLGIPEADALNFIEHSVSGLLQQLYNFPVDLLIERRLLRDHPRIRELVFVSVRKQVELSASIAQNERLRSLTPTLIFRANAAMNGAQALWLEEEYPHRTDLIEAFRRNDSWSTAESLYRSWKDEVENWSPGNELDWVDRWAGAMKLQDWYRWLPDHTQG
jgi:tetratricopeptide (TPR) repeat protein